MVRKFLREVKKTIDVDNKNTTLKVIGMASTDSKKNDVFPELFHSQIVRFVKDNIPKIRMLPE